MTTPSETGATQPQSWAEQFKATHPIEGLPAEARATFEGFLDNRAGIIRYYETFPQDRWDEKIGVGNSAREDLVDLIATSRVRNQAIRAGRLESWEDPEKTILKTLGGSKLIAHLDTATSDFYDLIAQVDLESEIPLPYDKKTTVKGLMLGAFAHEVLHLGFAIKFGDHFGNPETNTPIERPTAVKKLYG